MKTSNYRRLFILLTSSFILSLLGIPPAIHPPDETKLVPVPTPALTLTMKRYFLYTYYVGRAFGGHKDYLDSFDDIQEALDNILNEPNRYYQIVDSHNMRVAKEGLAVFKNFVPEPNDCEGD
jgi:hypothetical protein